MIVDLTEIKRLYNSGMRVAGISSEIVSQYIGIAKNIISKQLRVSTKGMEAIYLPHLDKIVVRGERFIKEIRW